MRNRLFALLLVTLTLMSAGCGAHRSGDPQSLTAAQSAAVDKDVRAFMQTVAHGVSQDGPTAWRKYFADDPSFFMAVDGQMAFPNSAAATAAIANLPRLIKSITLQWGDNLRVDPLTLNLAVVAAAYHEVQVSPAGQSMDEHGYFTATAEYRDGRWQFRNAHWSTGPPPSAPVAP